ncbi:MAG TPA: hypothetical protein VMU32_08315 [Solirubrobacteraceae bacterium]|nr:hypothetical protein [Solirubrobacteraceae bacterium]
MPRPAEARAWWAEVEDVRERIERRRAREAGPTRRGVRVVSPGVHPLPSYLRSVERAGEGADARGSVTGLAARRRPRARPAQLVGQRPDRIASWAVALGFLLLLAAILSAH